MCVSKIYATVFVIILCHYDVVMLTLCNFNLLTVLHRYAHFAGWVGVCQLWWRERFQAIVNERSILSRQDRHYEIWADFSRTNGNNCWIWIWSAVLHYREMLLCVWNLFSFLVTNFILSTALKSHVVKYDIWFLV